MNTADRREIMNMYRFLAAHEKATMEELAREIRSWWKLTGQDEDDFARESDAILDQLIQEEKN